MNEDELLFDLLTPQIQLMDQHISSNNGLTIIPKKFASLGSSAQSGGNIISSSEFPEIDFQKLEIEKDAVINAPENKYFRSLLVSTTISIYRISGNRPSYPYPNKHSYSNGNSLKQSFHSKSRRYEFDAKDLAIDPREILEVSIDETSVPDNCSFLKTLEYKKQNIFSKSRKVAENVTKQIFNKKGIKFISLMDDMDSASDPDDNLNSIYVENNNLEVISLSGNLTYNEITSSMNLEKSSENLTSMDNKAFENFEEMTIDSDMNYDYEENNEESYDGENGSDNENGNLSSDEPKSDKDLYITSDNITPADFYQEKILKDDDEEDKLRSGGDNDSRIKFTKEYVTGRLTCGYCPYNTLYKSNLLAHIRVVHLKAKVGNNRVHICEICSYSTSHKSNVMAHIRSVHFRIKPNMKLHQCEKCDFSANRRSQLAQHIQEEHKDDDRIIGPDGRQLYGCDRCSYRATQKGNLNTHKRVVHDQTRQFSCSSCSYVAAKKSNLMTHIAAVHHHERRYACQLCSFKATQKGNLKAHITAVHQRIVECHVCKMKFNRTKSLVKHLTLIHDVSPESEIFDSDSNKMLQTTERLQQLKSTLKTELKENETESLILNDEIEDNSTIGSLILNGCLEVDEESVSLDGSYRYESSTEHDTFEENVFNNIQSSSDYRQDFGIN